MGAGASLYSLIVYLCSYLLFFVKYYCLELRFFQGEKMFLYSLDFFIPGYFFLVIK